MKVRPFPILVLVALCVAGGWTWYVAAGQSATEDAEVDEEFSGLSDAQRRDLARRSEETVRERGVLESAETVELRCQIPGGTTILRLVPDGSDVKKGDLLVELDDSALEGEAQQRRIEFEAARSAVVLAERRLSLLRRLAKVQVAAARQAVALAELAAEKYTGKDGEYEFRRASVESEIAVTRQRVEAANARLERARKQDPGEVESARLQVVEAQAALAAAEGKKKLLTGPAHRYESAALKLEQARRSAELQKVEEETGRAIAESEAELRAARSEMQLAELQLKRSQRQIDACRLTAPRDGVVVYAPPASRRVEPVLIEEGTQVREGQAILRVIDMKRLRVRVRVHESRISRVREGQPVRLHFDAIPRRVLGGKVAEVGRRPERGDWPNSDVIYYDVLVALERPVPELKPGMSCMAEIDVSNEAPHKRPGP